LFPFQSSELFELIVLWIMSMIEKIFNILGVHEPDDLEEYERTTIH
jgi:hypothetical protein